MTFAVFIYSKEYFPSCIILSNTDTKTPHSIVDWKIYVDVFDIAVKLNWSFQSM